ncbi:MAG: winged helix-turn-helix domain-containing protein [Terriglobales bacterium]|jgi:DNA-binding winged helix-turn-helix (wHTH) protein/tetratricopeptide (TPR) repeat protein
MPADVSANVVVRFGVFEADLRSGELRKCGSKVKIQELPFRALKLLLSRPNEVLSREDLRQALWPDGVYVDFDRGVISAINRVRDALGDSAENPIFIETVGRRGYRWIAPTQVEPLPEAAIRAESKHVVVDEPAASTSARRLTGNWTGKWKFLFVVPALAVLLAAGHYWPRHDATNAGPSRSNSGKGNTALPPGSSAPGLAHRAANRDAEEFYLKGRYYWEKRTPESLTKAVDFFTQAIVHDPNFAQAYVGLADCYNLLREYTVMPSSEAFPRAQAAAKRAVELDPQSSEAHASLAFVSFFGMWDVVTADREFRRAIELDPNNAAAHHWYATYLMCLRRRAESLAEIERARSLDPASKSVLADKGMLLFDAGQQQEGMALLKQMEESEPDFISPHRFLGEIYLLTGDYPHYLSEARSEATLVHDSSAIAIADAAEKGYAARGSKGLLEALLRQQQELYDHGQLSPYNLAETYSVLERRQEALQYLRRAYDLHADGMFSIEIDRAFDKLHDEPAFRRILADVGLPPLN